MVLKLINTLEKITGITLYDKDDDRRKCDERKKKNIENKIFFKNTNIELYKKLIESHKLNIEISKEKIEKYLNYISVLVKFKNILESKNIKTSHTGFFKMEIDDGVNELFKLIRYEKNVIYTEEIYMNDTIKEKNINLDTIAGKKTDSGSKDPDKNVKTDMNDVESFMRKNFINTEKGYNGKKGYHSRFLIDILAENGLNIGIKKFNQTMDILKIGTYDAKHTKALVENDKGEFIEKEGGGYYDMIVKTEVLPIRKLS